MEATVYKNVLSWRGCEKLHLNDRSSDVYFQFHSVNGVEKVPAHKCILSAVSPVFDAMFYGPNKQIGDIDIVNASAGAFKEFLQFFYRSQVKLTIENVSEVMNLCKEYLLDDWEVVSMVGTNLCTTMLTVDDMCWAYEFAVLFEMDELKEFCEKKIGENAIKIFQSSSFLNCQRNLLQHILQLNSLNCKESEVFDGCMAWARAQCKQNNNCNGTDTTELRAQLGELFYEIRFGDMTHSEFQERYQLYDGLFSLEEFRDITMMIVNDDFRPADFNWTPRRGPNGKQESTQQHEIQCTRLGPFTVDEDHGRKFQTSTTKFISTSTWNLKKISCYVVSTNPKFEINAKVQIHKNCVNENKRGTLVSSIETALPSNGVYCARGSGIVELPYAVAIQAGVVYEIAVELDSYCKPMRFTNTIRMEDGTVIEFFDNSKSSVVNGLHFVA